RRVRGSNIARTNRRLAAVQIPVAPVPAPVDRYRRRVRAREVAGADLPQPAAIWIPRKNLSRESARWRSVGHQVLPEPRRSAGAARACLRHRAGAGGASSTGDAPPGGAPNTPPAFAPTAPHD